MVLLNHVLLLLSWSLCVVHSHIHKCIHDELEHPMITVHQNYHPIISSLTDATSSRRRLPSQEIGDTYLPIRIKPYYDYLDTVETNTTLRNFIKELVSTSIRYFEQFLYVRRIQGPLYVYDSRMSSWSASNPMGDSFFNSAQHQPSYSCGAQAAVPIPKSHWKPEWTWSSYQDIIPDTSIIYHEGISDTDLIIYINADNSYCGDNTLAFASACVLDQNGRPIAGRINFCDQLLDINEWTDDVSTAIHEITHVLGFASGLYSYYKNSSGQLYSGDLPTKIFGDYTYITTPKVVQFAKSHTGCNTANGALIENSGGQGTAGSHWDEKYIFNEYMTGIHRSPFEQMSKYTLSLFEDMGWYIVDYAYAKPYFWGKNTGCNWYTQTCLTAGNPPTINFPQFFHNTYTYDNTNPDLYDKQYGCSSDYAFGTYLPGLISNPTPPPTSFQYWTIDSSYCPLGGDTVECCPIRWSQIDTTDFGGICIDIRGNTLDTSSLNPVYSNNSRCVQFTESSGTDRGKCYKHECLNNNNNVNIYFDSYIITCNKTETLSYKTLIGGTRNGYKIQCPDIDIICNGQQPFACFFGYWNDNLNKCICNAGYIGTNCDIKDVAILPPLILGGDKFIGQICITYSSLSILNGFWEYDNDFGVYSSWTKSGYYLYFDAWYHLWMISNIKGSQYTNNNFVKYCSAGNTNIITPNLCNGKWYNNPYPNLDNNMKLGLGKCATLDPTQYPTLSPTEPTINPSKNPTKNPTIFPTKNPTISPTKNPTLNPTQPTEIPSKTPTNNPTKNPTQFPTKPPTISPTKNPSINPTKYPTLSPTIPTTFPTKYPTLNPTISTIFPTKYPTTSPTFNPSLFPTETQTNNPTQIRKSDSDGIGGLIHNLTNPNKYGIVEYLIFGGFGIILIIFIIFICCCCIRQKNKNRDKIAKSTNVKREISNELFDQHSAKATSKRTELTVISDTEPQTEPQKWLEI